MKVSNFLKKQGTRILAVFLALAMIFTAMPSTYVFANTAGKFIDVWDFGAKVQQGELYKNHITSKDMDSLTNLGEDGKTIEPGTLSLDNGNMEINLVKQERFYYFADDQSNKGTKSAGNPAKKDTFANDIYQYTGNGYFYFNGAGNEKSRYFLIHNVNKGDRITVYGFEDNVTSSIVHFDYQDKATDGQAVQKATAALGTPFIYEVVAENTGTYKLWFDSNGGKMRIYRIVRAPYVKVTGKIDLAGNKIPAYTVHFLNKTTKQLTAATVKPTGEYSVNLAPGYQYIAMLKDVTGYGFTNETKSVNITTKDIATDKTAVNLKVEPKVMYTLSGSIKGFAKDYDVSKLEIKMNPPKEDSITQPQVVSINKKEMTYSVTLESNIDYTAQLTGANDYDISSGASCKNKLNVKQDIAVATKPVYNVSGNFIGLSSATSVKEVVFKNMSDGYTYKGAVSGTGFTAKLRQGDYEVSLVNDTLKTLGHISINKADVKKDIMVSLIKPVQQTYAWVSDIYVGYADKKNNFKTLSEAVEAAATMNIQSEQQRVTVHIAPGVYRQQLIVDTPYLTFVNDEPSKGEVKLTWYYGIGYKYYSVRNVDSTSGVKGYYDKELAFDKYLKAPVEKWGTAVYLTSKANGFTAKDIVFENSFNRYVTKEEIADGVEVAGTSDIKLERKIDSAVNTRAYKERAAAMYIDADRVEFENCSFLSNQDTLGTGASGTHKYFKNCLIEGGTDYICGGGDCVFDNCQLNWFGASDQALTGQVITAAKADTNGYLFRNCTVTTTSSTNSNNMRSTGLFGRPWDQAAKVAFLNTKFENENSIDPAGWTSMSSATPAKASFFEANSTYNASVLDTTSREATLISSTAKAEDYNVKNFFGDWTPNYYVQESETSPVFEVAPTITSTNENKVLTVDYRFEAENDNLNDASLIQWYRVDSDGVETFIECNVAYISTSYTIKPEDKGFYIKAVVTPEVVSGLKAEAVAIQTGEKVK